MIEAILNYVTYTCRRCLGYFMCDLVDNQMVWDDVVIIWISCEEELCTKSHIWARII